MRRLLLIFASVWLGFAQMNRTASNDWASTASTISGNSTTSNYSSFPSNPANSYDSNSSS
ncbi:hypothetical protein COOONC_16196, partial [Cooperia oncophora]